MKLRQISPISKYIAFDMGAPSEPIDKRVRAKNAPVFFMRERTRSARGWTILGSALVTNS